MLASAADLGIPEVGQVEGLDPAAEDRLLGLDEVAHADVFLEHGARAQARERPDARARADRGAVDVAVREHDDARLDGPNPPPA